jgi:hypothetical protein
MIARCLDFFLSIAIDSSPASSKLDFAVVIMSAPRFIVTDFMFPTSEHHEVVTLEEAQWTTGNKTWDELPTPAHQTLAANRVAMQAKGAVFYEGVDGFAAMDWVRQQKWDVDSLGFVSWGSPHVLLPDGTESHAKESEAKDEKLRIFKLLKQDFQHCVVLVTYALHDIPCPNDEGCWLLHFRNENPRHVYVPRFSTGWSRCTEDEVMALLYLPPSLRENWQAFSDLDGNLHYQRLLKLISKSLLFLGEERADLSRLAVECLA